MGSDSPVGTLSEDELRQVISLQIVIDSARAACLEVASPVNGGEGRVLLVYGGEATAESPLRARRVRVRAFDSGLETAALAERVSSAELLALVEWGGFGEGDAVFVLAAMDIEGVRSGQAALSECLATSGRWRTLVLG
jgi:hypothetical protein